MLLQNVVMDNAWLTELSANIAIYTWISLPYPSRDVRIFLVIIGGGKVPFMRIIDNDFGQSESSCSE